MHPIWRCLSLLNSRRWLLLAGFLCALSLLAQARSPWASEPSLFLAQAIAMGMGLVGVGIAPGVTNLPIPSIKSHAVLLVFVVAGTMFFSFRATERAWPLLGLGWAAFLLLVGLTLRLWQTQAGLWVKLTLNGVWALLAFTAFIRPWGVSQLLIPICLAGILLLFWTGRWKLGLTIGLLCATVAVLRLLSSPYLYARVQLRWILMDPLGSHYQAFQMRQVFTRLGLTGPIAPMPFVPNANVHGAQAVLAHAWGWLGIALWFGIQVGILVKAFCISWKRRNEASGVFLAILAMTLLCVSLLGLSLTFGFPGQGQALPLLGLDPSMAMMSLGMLGLIAKMNYKATVVVTGP